MEYTLDKLKANYAGNVVCVNSDLEMKNRLLDIGITDGTKIECLFNGSRDEINAYLIKGAIIALRKEDAQNIMIDTN